MTDPISLSPVVLNPVVSLTSYSLAGFYGCVYGVYSLTLSCLAPVYQTSSRGLAYVANFTYECMSFSLYQTRKYQSN